MNNSKESLPISLAGLTIKQLRQLISEALSAYYSAPESSIIADILLCHLLQLQKHELIIHRNETIDEAQGLQLQQYINRLLAHEPIQYVIGTVKFCGHCFQIDKRALIPRPETEELVHWAIDTLRNNQTLHSFQSTTTILDFGTGSGCIAISLALALPNCHVWGIDNSIDALNLARLNADRLGATNVRFIEADMEHLEQSTQLKDINPVQVIISNPPYVPLTDAESLAPHVRHFEPHQALFTPSHSPLYFYHRLIDFAKTTLSPGGFVFFEGHEAFVPSLKELLIHSGFTSVEQRADFNGLARMVVAQSVS